MIDYATIKNLAREHGLTVTDLTALAPKNDPFYTGRPSEVQAAEWFADLWQRFGYHSGVHLRRVHYQTQAQDPPIPLPTPLSWKEKLSGTPRTTGVYINNERCWDYLTEAGKWARYRNLVPPGAFVDRRNPEALIHAYWYNPGQELYEDPTPRYTPVNLWIDDDYGLPELPELPELPADLPEWPGFVVHGYSGLQQDYHLEIWVEKTTMNDVLLPVCRRYNVNLITGAGEMSITSVLDFMKRVERADRPARIIYISDFDPAGLGMPISVARKIEYFQRNEGYDGLDIRLQPLALTAGQIADYNLPRVPVKDSDLRKDNFEAAHGQGAVELDALEALHPGELTRIATSAILNYYDPTLHHRARERRAELATALNMERDTILDDFNPEMTALENDYEGLLDDYAQTRQQFDDLARQFQPELDRYQDRLTEIRIRAAALYAVLTDELDMVDLDLDPYALPAPILPDEPGDMLYNSYRTYLDQLESYKAHRLGLNGNGHQEAL